jgi:hypothetical protein
VGPDVSFGLDWKASVRELLLVQGHLVLVSFDPFESYLPSGMYLFFFFGFCRSSNIVVVLVEGATNALSDQGLRASSLSEPVSTNHTPVHACPLSRPDIESVAAAAGVALPSSWAQLEPSRCPDPPWGANNR